MNKSRLNRILVSSLALVMVSVLAISTACTPGEAKQLEGILQNVDAANGEITITTKDGQTVTLTITTETPVESEGASTNVSTLRPGASVKVEVDKGERVARHISAQRPEVKWGAIEIRATDPPPADVKSAIIYLKNIEVHKASENTSENTSDNASGWIPIIGAPPSFDLMDVIGVETVLGSANVTAGSFTQIRMEIEKVVGVTAEGDNFTAEIPGNELKIVRPFNVGAGKVTVLTLDFDGENSLIITGKGKALFKPVVRLLIDGKEDDETSRRGPSAASENRTEGKKPETASENKTEERGRGRQP